jgi:hypothetical protein
VCSITMPVVRTFVKTNATTEGAPTPAHKAMPVQPYTGKRSKTEATKAEAPQAKRPPIGINPAAAYRLLCERQSRERQLELPGPTAHQAAAGWTSTFIGPSGGTLAKPKLVMPQQGPRPLPKPPLSAAAQAKAADIAVRRATNKAPWNQADSQKRAEGTVSEEEAATYERAKEQQTQVERKESSEGMSGNQEPEQKAKEEQPSEEEKECENPQCRYPVNPMHPGHSPGFCCENCEARFQKVRWAFICKPSHNSSCRSKSDAYWRKQRPFLRQCVEAYGRQKAELPAAPKRKCAHGDCMFATSETTLTVGEEFCCRECETADDADKPPKHGKRCEGVVFGACAPRGWCGNPTVQLVLSKYCPHDRPPGEALCTFCFVKDMNKSEASTSPVCSKLVGFLNHSGEHFSKASGQLVDTRGDSFEPPTRGVLPDYAHEWTGAHFHGAAHRLKPVEAPTSGGPDPGSQPPIFTYSTIITDKATVAGRQGTWVVDTPNTIFGVGSVILPGDGVPLHGTKEIISVQGQFIGLQWLPPGSVIEGYREKRAGEVGHMIKDTCPDEPTANVKPTKSSSS